MFVSDTFNTMPTLPLAGLWMGDAASETAQSVDSLYGLITWIGIFFFILVTVLTITFVVKYRARPGHAEVPSPSHNNALEIIWSVIPVLLVAMIFFLSFTTYMDMRTPPDDALDIQVIASKWKFLFRYPNGAEDEVLHVPMGRPVRLVQQSQDVIHSLYIPAFRTKMDCVPGKYTYQWFTATKPGEYDLFCAEYCGLDHSNMNSIVVVYENESDYKAKLDLLNKPPDDPIEWGKLVWDRKGCKQCHSIDGSVRAGGGPSWKGIWQKNEAMADGTTVTIDENYINESIRQPQAKIVAGFQGVNMSAYPPSIVKQEEVDALIAFIKSLKD